MNKHEYIKAKGAPHWTSLHNHIQHALIAITKFASYCGVNIEIARLGAILHDIGKVHPVFQLQLTGEKPTQTFRHELATLFFLSLVSDDQKDTLIEMIVGHHKSIDQDIGQKGILDLLQHEQDPLNYHLGDWETWSPIALEIIETFGIRTKPISRSEAIASWEYAVAYCEKVVSTQRGFSIWRGLLMGADYFASSQLDKTKTLIDRAFHKANLHFYSRQHSLYPLSFKNASSDRPHTIIVAPTGSGKTDYLLRRCKGRVFYMLPFQASINAMYRRLKADLEELNPDLDIRILHAASSLEEETDPSLQSMIGASIKVLTPYQLAGIAFGSKGYESLILDIRGCDVILDEVHTYSGISQAIVLKIVSILKALGCRVHIGTATMPSILYQKILDILGTTSVLQVGLTEQELRSYNRHIVHKLENWQQSHAIIQQAIAAGQKVLLICNQVERAQEVFDYWRQHVPDPDILLLHSRFKRKDRNKKETLLTHYFNNLDKACIVVATQVVEVSLDISFDLMVTEAAPLDALLQRFGRIHRIRNKETIGTVRPVYVIAPPVDASAAVPYDLDILHKSFQVLPDGHILEASRLQALIDTVFTDIDLVRIETYSVFKDTGHWTIPLLTHRSSMLLDLLDIDNVVCITESDQDAYLKSSPDEKLQYEIPARYHAVKNYPRESEYGPFIIPDPMYSDEFGLLVRKSAWQKKELHKLPK